MLRISLRRFQKAWKKHVSSHLLLWEGRNKVTEAAAQEHQPASGDTWQGLPAHHGTLFYQLHGPEVYAMGLIFQETCTWNCPGLQRETYVLGIQ